MLETRAEKLLWRHWRPCRPRGYLGFVLAISPVFPDETDLMERTWTHTPGPPEIISFGLKISSLRGGRFIGVIQRFASGFWPLGKAPLRPQIGLAIPRACGLYP